MELCDISWGLHFWHPMGSKNHWQQSKVISRWFLLTFPPAEVAHTAGNNRHAGDDAFRWDSTSNCGHWPHKVQKCLSLNSFWPHLSSFSLYWMMLCTTLQCNDYKKSIWWWWKKSLTDIPDRHSCDRDQGLLGGDTSLMEDHGRATLKKQACKLKRCASYLRNLKLSLSHSLTDRGRC